MLVTRSRNYLRSEMSQMLLLLRNSFRVFIRRQVVDCYGDPIPTQGGHQLGRLLDCLTTLIV